MGRRLIACFVLCGGCGYIGLDYVDAEVSAEPTADPIEGGAGSGTDPQAGASGAQAGTGVDLTFAFAADAPWQSTDGSATLMPQGEPLAFSDDGPFPGTRAVNLSATGYLVLPDEPRWQMESGSVSLYFRTTTCVAAEGSHMFGLITRDAFGTASGGHLYFGFSFSPSCGLTARIQRQDAETDSTGSIFGGTAAPIDIWHHAGVNFGTGGFELWLNGELLGALPDEAHGINGNQNPWVIGANSMPSDEGSATPVGSILPGEIALVRISDSRQDFSAARLPGL